jgi:hypothetical protein
MPEAAFRLVSPSLESAILSPPMPGGERRELTAGGGVWMGRQMSKTWRAFDDGEVFEVRLRRVVVWSGPLSPP